ncbi:MAG: hypothetical protein ACR2PG_16750 [Hyphomicrobiaceae bacterium]
MTNEHHLGWIASASLFLATLSFALWTVIFPVRAQHSLSEYSGINKAAMQIDTTHALEIQSHEIAASVMSTSVSCYVIYTRSAHCTSGLRRKTAMASADFWKNRYLDTNKRLGLLKNQTDIVRFASFRRRQIRSDRAWTCGSPAGRDMMKTCASRATEADN